VLCGQPRLLQDNWNLTVHAARIADADLGILRLRLSLKAQEADGCQSDYTKE